MEISLKKQIEELQSKLKTLERDYHYRDSIWEARLRYSRRGLEVTNRELAYANSKLAKVNRELNELKKGLEKKVEERTKEVRLEHDRISQIIAHLSDGIIIISNKKVITLMNREAEKLLNCKAQTVLGRAMETLQKIPVAGTLFTYLNQQTFADPLFRFRLELAEKSENKTLEVTTTIVQVTKEITEIVVLLHDITREALVERLKTQFISITAHQLRTPLTSIKWILSMLYKGELDGALTETQSEHVRQAYDSTERMITLVNDHLDVVKIEEGRFDYSFTPGPISLIIQEVMAELKILANKKHMRLDLRLPKNPLPLIPLDKDRIRLACSNIIENAIHYTKSSGLVTISVKKRKTDLLISVRDTGIGIPLNQYDHLFTKFFRADNAMREQTEGNGLGLYITKNIIEQHHGKIWFTSAEGTGSTFSFTLPLKAKLSRSRTSRVK